MKYEKLFWIPFIPAVVPSDAFEPYMVGCDKVSAFRINVMFEPPSIDQENSLL